MNSTIAAIATPVGNGGIGIVRISGSLAKQIGESLFSVPLSDHEMILGSIKDNGKILDRALCCYFKAPKSYTGEDVVEFHCHGGNVVCRLVMEAAIKKGAVSAEAGEFTRRAFLNNKIDLTQAEAIADIINADTAASASVAANQIKGILSDKIGTIRTNILDLSARLLASLDFPEEIDDLPREDFEKAISDILGDISSLLKTADNGRIIKDGLNVAIVGTSNVGKSSLLNLILGEDRAIVTDIEGTTRDVLEASANIHGCKINLIDTAGIRESCDVIENIGIERSKQMIENADLVLFTVDGSRELNSADIEVMSLIKGKNVISVINKCDLTLKINPEDFENPMCISAKTGEGIDALFEYIYSKYSSGDIQSTPIITNNRHKEALLRASSFIENVAAGISAFSPADMLLGELELALSALGEIDGLTVSEEIIDNIFANFCVGK